MTGPVGITRDALVDGGETARSAYRCAMSRSLHDVRAVAVDDRGAVIVAIGPAPGGSAGVSGVQKLDSEGRPRWSFHAGPGEDFAVSTIAADTEGSVIVGGMGSWTTLDPSGKAHAESGTVLVKLDSDGRLLWRDFEAWDANLSRTDFGCGVLQPGPDADQFVVSLMPIFEGADGS